jgi:signal peptidase
MTALRWTRRLLDALLVVAVLAVVVTAATQLLAPVAGGRAMVVGGGSMEPAIGRGAFVLTLPAGSDGYAVGDVVTVQQGGGTPYTHRITRLADLAGVPHVETKGDANAAPDPAIVPTAAIIGRVALSIPLLGYLVMLLATAAGLAGFLAVCATMLLLVWVIEEVEDQRCPECAAAAAEREAGPASAAARAQAAGSAQAGPVTATALAGLPAFAVSAPPSRVRATGRPRDPGTPVLLERDRRDPRRHGTPTFPDAPPAPAQAGAALVADSAALPAAAELRDAADQYPAGVAA